MKRRSSTRRTVRHGYGADALAFRFNRNGVLIAPPAYIAQGLPYDFYMRRIGSLTRGRATTQDVEAMFGRSHSRANRPDGFMWYYALPVYNPFEERGGRREMRASERSRPMSWNRSMRAAIFLATLFGASVSAIASDVDHHQP